MQHIPTHGSEIVIILIFDLGDAIYTIDSNEGVREYNAVDPVLYLYPQQCFMNYQDLYEICVISHKVSTEPLNPLSCLTLANDSQFCMKVKKA